MSAARLAAEAAFADPGVPHERPPAPPVLVEVRPRRVVTTPVGDEHPAGSDGPPLPPGDRPSRVFRMDPALRQAMGLPNVEEGASAAHGPGGTAPVPTRRRRRTAPPVHVVHAAADAAGVAAKAPTVANALVPMTAHWAPIADALARLEATFDAIRAAQDFNRFAEIHLPPSAEAP